MNSRENPVKNINLYIDLRIPPLKEFNIGGRLMNIIRTGLCVLIMGFTTATLNKNAVAETPSINRTTVSLEVITEQNNFISPDGNYSLKNDPKQYGFDLSKHLVKSGVGYDDTYSSPIGTIEISGLKTKRKLRDIYNSYSISYARYASRFVLAKYLS